MALSSTALQAMTAQETGEAALTLLTITHPATTESARAADGWTQRLGEDPLRYGVISRGQIFFYVPMSVVLPDASEEAPPLARLIIDNIDRSLIALIRSHQAPATIQVEVVLASTPDVVERTYPALEVRHAQYDALQVVLELAYRPLAQESWPSHSMTPGRFPGLFR